MQRPNYPNGKLFIRDYFTLEEKQKYPYIKTGVFLGVDFGKINDYHAQIAVRVVHDARWLKNEYKLSETPFDSITVIAAKRLPLNKEYLKQADDIAATNEKLKRFTGDTPVILTDRTGVGEPVIENIERLGIYPYNVWFHAGRVTNKSGRKINIPKQDLMDNLLVLFESGALRISKQLDFRDVLEGELKAFQFKVNNKGTRQFGNNPSQASNDDLVSALALACWGAVNLSSGANIVGKTFSEAEKEYSYDEIRNFNGVRRRAKQKDNSWFRAGRLPTQKTGL